MQEHAVPRQITSFEFKLIGFMSVKQFIYLLLATGLTVSVYFLIPIPYVNFVFAGLVAAGGAGFTFYKYNERGVDVWVKNFYFAATKPSKFVYFKNNPIPDFLKDVYVSQDSGTSETHIDATKKLSNYMNKTGQAIKNDPSTQHITKLIIETQASDHTKKVVGVEHDDPTHVAAAGSVTGPVAPDSSLATPGKKQPIVSGVIKNSKNEPLADVMVYINADSGQTVRILKTNHNGIFATFHELPAGSYKLNPKDLNALYFFDTINIVIDGSPQKPMTIYSKEVL